MARISVSIKADQLAWLRKHPEVNASGLMQRAIEQLIVGELDYDQKLVRELEKRLGRIRWKWRPRVIIDDVRFPITTSYPIEEADYIVTKAEEFAKHIRDLEKPPGSTTFSHPKSTGVQYVEISLYKTPDTYTEPVVELKSRLLL